MIAVSLAGTLFFAAATDAQRGNVALYLLVTMAPFARARPGHRPGAGPAAARPALGAGRQPRSAARVLALVMARALRRLLALPGGAGRAGAVARRTTCCAPPSSPGCCPPAMSLTSANARLSVFGLATGGVAGAIGAGIAGAARLRLGARGHRRRCSPSPGCWRSGCPGTSTSRPASSPPTCCTTAEIPVPGGRRRRVSPHVVLALRANAALRGLGGFLTIFCAFLVQATVRRRLGGDAGARARSPPPPGVGSFAGHRPSASRLHTAAPDRVVLVAAGAAAGDHRAGRGLLQLRDGGRGRRRRRGDQRAGQGGARRDHPARGARQPARVGVRPVGDRGCSWPGWSAARSGIALPPTGWLGFTVAAALLVLAVGLDRSGACAAAGPPAPVDREASDADAPHDPRGTAVVVSRAAACRAARARSSAGCGGGEAAGPAPTSTVRSARRRSPSDPTQYCLDGEGQRYDDHPADPRGAPPTPPISADRARVGRRARLERAGLRRAARGDASARSTSPRASAPFEEINTSDVVPPAFYLVVVEDKGGDCGELSGAWPVGFLRAGGDLGATAVRADARPAGSALQVGRRPRAAPRRPCGTRRGRGAGRAAAPRRRRRAA